MSHHGTSGRKRQGAKNRKHAHKATRERERRDKRVTARYGKSAHGSCGRKVRYHSFYEANQVIRWYPVEKLAAYRCEYCGGWHLTSHPRRVSADEIGGEPLTVLDRATMGAPTISEERRGERE